MKKLLLYSGSILFGLHSTTLGSTVQWGGKFSSNNYLNDGTLISSTSTPSANFVFALGVFTNNFIPTEQNAPFWRENWRELSSTPYNLNTQYFTGSFSLEDTNDTQPGIQFNGETFNPGEQVHLWGYDNVSDPSGSNWVLGRGISSTDTSMVDPSDTNWEIPDLTDSSQSDLPLSWRTATLNDVTLGSIEGIQGDGNFTPPTSQPNPDIQFSFVVIPEPEQTTLVGLTFLYLMFLRRKKPTN